MLCSLSRATPKFGNFDQSRLGQQERKFRRNNGITYLSRHLQSPNGSCFPTDDITSKEQYRQITDEVNSNNGLGNKFRSSGQSNFQANCKGRGRGVGGRRLVTHLSKLEVWSRSLRGQSYKITLKTEIHVHNTDMPCGYITASLHDDL